MRGTTWKQYTIANTPLPYDQIQDIAVDSNNHVWISYSQIGGIVVGGIAEFDGAEWTLYTTTTSGLPTSVVSDLDFDSEGNLWINSNAGLIKYDGLNWIIFTTSNSDLLLMGATQWK